MKIGIDARLLGEPVTGIGRYTIELTRALIRFPHRFYIYTSRPVAAERWQYQNVKIRTGRCHGRPGRMLWSQTFLPYWTQKDRIDLFWGPTHRIPYLLPEKTARVLTVHDLVWKHVPQTMRSLSWLMERLLMPPAVARADRIMADSMSTVRGLRAAFPRAKKRIRPVYPGITELPEPLGPDALAALRITRPYFIFTGTLEPRKNLWRLLLAFSQLPERLRKKNQMVIVGGKGWGGINIDDFSKKLGIRRDVVVTGYIDDATLASLYAHARFLAMPSLYEGFGFPLVEAMASGTPVLTSSTSSMPEVAGNAAVLVDPQDEHAIAEGLKALLSDDELRNRLASRAKANAARFSWEKTACRTMKIFEEAIAERNVSLS